MAYQASLKKLDEWDKELDSKSSSYNPSISNLDKLDNEIAQQEKAPPQTWTQSLDDASKFISTAIAQVPIESVQELASLPQILSMGLIKNPFSKDYKIAGAGENYLAKLGLMEAKVPGYEGGPYQDAVTQGLAAVLPFGPGAMGVMGRTSDLVKRAASSLGNKAVSPIRNIANILNGKKERELLSGIHSQEKEAIDKLSNELSASDVMSKFKSSQSVKKPAPSIEKEVNSLIDEKLTDFYGTSNYRKLSGKEDSLLRDAVKGNYESKVEDASGLYDRSLKENAKKSIIGDEYKQINLSDKFLKQYLSSKKTPTLLDQHGNAVLSSSEALKLKKLSFLTKAIGKRSNFSINPGLKQAYRDFFKNSNVGNAHELQSNIGHAVRGLYQKEHGERDYDLIDSLTKAKDFLQDKIIEKTGGSNSSYAAARDFYRQNVIPYWENSSINKATEGISSDNLVEQFTKRENKSRGSIGAVNTALEHMSDKQKRLIMANVVKESVPTVGEVNAPKFIESLQGATHKGYGEFILPEDKAHIRDLTSNLKRIDEIKNIRGGFAKKAQVQELKRRQDLIEEKRIPFQKERERISESEKSKREIMKFILKTGGGALGVTGAGMVGYNILKQLGL